MAVRQLPVVGRPTNPPTPLRKIAIEEHFIDPPQAHPNYGDSFSGEFDQEGSSYAGFNPEFAEVVSARVRDLRDGHRRGPVDRDDFDQRKRPPEDLLRQRRGSLRPPQVSPRTAASSAPLS
jgi:hypothetical protein